MANPLQFFLRCDPDARHFYAVEIHDDKESMERAVAELKGVTLAEVQEEELEAVCLRYVVRRERKDTKLRALQEKHDQIGTIFFVRGNISFSTAVHELTHAAVGWAKRAKVNPLKFSKNYATCPEERFARTVQFLVEQFYEKALPILAPQQQEKAA